MVSVAVAVDKHIACQPGAPKLDSSSARLGAGVYEAFTSTSDCRNANFFETIGLHNLTPPNVPPPRNRRTPRKFRPRESHVQEIARSHRAAGGARKQNHHPHPRRRWQADRACEAGVGQRRRARGFAAAASSSSISVGRGVRCLWERCGSVQVSELWNAVLRASLL